jgi:hypothetical protein
MHDAGLNLGERKDAGDCFGKSFEPIDHRDQNISHTSVFYLGYHSKPEFCSLGLFDPDPQDVFGPVWQDSDQLSGPGELLISSLVFIRTQLATDARAIEDRQRLSQKAKLLTPTYCVEVRVLPKKKVFSTPYRDNIQLCRRTSRDGFYLFIGISPP